MSINRNYYVIAGYDLTDMKTDKYDDWKWTDEGEQFLCYQFKDRVQLFDDPMSDGYLYLGHILAAGDEWEFETTKFDILDVQNAFNDVTCILARLQDAGVVTKDPKCIPVFQIIAFVEYT